jgi:hypothetical protein
MSYNDTPKTSVSRPALEDAKKANHHLFIGTPGRVSVQTGPVLGFGITKHTLQSAHSLPFLLPALITNNGTKNIVSLGYIDPSLHKEMFTQPSHPTALPTPLGLNRRHPVPNNNRHTHKRRHTAKHQCHNTPRLKSSRDRRRRLILSR